jgi:hypothetical protein
MLIRAPAPGRQDVKLAGSLQTHYWHRDLQGEQRHFDPLLDESRTFGREVSVEGTLVMEQR